MGLYKKVFTLGWAGEVQPKASGMRTALPGAVIALHRYCLAVAVHCQRGEIIPFIQRLAALAHVTCGL